MAVPAPGDPEKQVQYVPEIKNTIKFKIEPTFDTGTGKLRAFRILIPKLENIISTFGSLSPILYVK